MGQLKVVATKSIPLIFIKENQFFGFFVTSTSFLHLKIKTTADIRSHSSNNLNSITTIPLLPVYPISQTFLNSDLIFFELLMPISIQAQFEQQAAANPARSQWIYHQMLQVKAFLCRILSSFFLTAICFCCPNGLKSIVFFML